MERISSDEKHEESKNRKEKNDSCDEQNIKIQVRHEYWFSCGMKLGSIRKGIESRHHMDTVNILHICIYLEQASLL